MTDILTCPPGTMVRIARMDCGSTHDKQTIENAGLKVGDIHTMSGIVVYGFKSELWLDFKHLGPFNTVFFEVVKAQELANHVRRLEKQVKALELSAKLGIPTTHKFHALQEEVDEARKWCATQAPHFLCGNCGATRFGADFMIRDGRCKRCR